MFGRGQFGDHRLVLIFEQQSKPHGHGGQDAGLVDRLARLIDRKRVALLLGQPEVLVDNLLKLFGLCGQFGRLVLFADESRDVRKAAQGGSSNAALVELAFDGEERPTFDPSVSDTKILRNALRVIGRLQKLVRLPETVPLTAYEFHVTALPEVIVHGDDVERGGIGGSVSVRIALETVPQRASRRNLAGNLAVVTLEF